jgi:TPR repeat protein
VKGLVLFAVLITTVFVFVGCADETVEPPLSSETTLQAETAALAETKALAESGDADAQFKLGSLYAEGKLVPNDFAEATKWFSKAGEQGHGEALYFLGIIHVRGFDTSSDITQGYIWFCLAAKTGFESATEDCDHFAGELSPEELSEANIRINVLFEEIQLRGKTQVTE